MVAAVTGVLARLIYAGRRADRGPHSFPTRRSSDLGAAAASAPSADQTVDITVDPVSDTPSVAVGSAVSLNENTSTARKGTRLNSSHAVMAYAVFATQTEDGGARHGTGAPQGTERSH